ncbi:hypothetical protein WwAna0477 [Wolbachia endosymbiont of Drosophila ananassae]|nr:hypothetical protein WwAna0477 [Wolbachia endosymbiont of Drosophila ananassae]
MSITDAPCGSYHLEININWIGKNFNGLILN